MREPNTAHAAAIIAAAAKEVHGEEVRGVRNRDGETRGGDAVRIREKRKRGREQAWGAGVKRQQTSDKRDGTDSSSNSRSWIG